MNSRIALAAVLTGCTLRVQADAYYRRYPVYPTRVWRPQAVLAPTGFEERRRTSSSSFLILALQGPKVDHRGFIPEFSVFATNPF